jgi:hypothetical protein
MFFDRDFLFVGFAVTVVCRIYLYSNLTDLEEGV